MSGSFGLGPQEILILVLVGGLLLMPVFAVVVALLVLVLSRNGGTEQDRATGRGRDAPAGARTDDRVQGAV